MTESPTNLSFKPKQVSKKLLSALNPRMKDIVSNRYGLENEKRMTLEAIGKNYDITRERVRQIENFALATIKKSPEYKENLFVFDELKDIVKKLEISALTVKTFEQGVERALLEGQIDIGLDCGRPYSNEIAFKPCASEPISIVCSPDFYKRHKENFKKQHYQALPMIYCERLTPERYAPEMVVSPKMQPIQFNDIASARAACINGLGWMFIPLYAVTTELKEKRLVKPFQKIWNYEKYGVWWLRSRVHLSRYTKVFEQWLSKADLSGN